MASIDLPLPEVLREFVEQEAALGGFATPEDFVRALISEEYENWLKRHQVENDRQLSEVRADIEVVVRESNA